MLRRWLPLWTWLAPLIGGALLAAVMAGVHHVTLTVGLGLALIACVLAAVHHAEIIAHRVGQPLGSFLLAIAVTVIEVALIVSLMLAKPETTTALARDTAVDDDHDLGKGRVARQSGGGLRLRQHQ